MRTYSDAELARAVADSRSWRGVLRLLGFAATSGAAARSVKAHADRLQLDHSHFTGQRRWTDAQLVDAVSASSSWAQVKEKLGLGGGSSTATMRKHSLRLGLDTHHLKSPAPCPSGEHRPLVRVHRLPRAGALLAAAWFELTGAEVSWPLEPCRYDLLVMREGEARRVQVKTTISRSGDTWTASLSCTSTHDKVYSAGEIDDFFVVDGDLQMYLIPFDVVAGRRAIQLRRYEAFAVGGLRPTS